MAYNTLTYKDIQYILLYTSVRDVLKQRPKTLIKRLLEIYTYSQYTKEQQLDYYLRH